MGWGVVEVEDGYGEVVVVGVVSDGLGCRVITRAIFSAAESMYSVYACAMRRMTFGRRDI